MVTFSGLTEAEGGEKGFTPQEYWGKQNHLQGFLPMTDKVNLDFSMHVDNIELKESL